MPTLYANPYANAPGFYFEDEDDYTKKMKKVRWEDHSIEFIDGDALELLAFNAFGRGGPMGGNLSVFFDLVEEDPETIIAFDYLSGTLGYSVEDALEKMGALVVVQASAEDYVYDMVHDDGIMPTNPDFYFDMESFGRDIRTDAVLEPDPEAYDDGEDDEDYIADLEEIDLLSDEEYGWQYVEGAYGDLEGMAKETPQIILDYFDVSALTRDMKINGEIDEVTVDGSDYAITNALGI